MANKYLEKIATAGIVPDESGPGLKHELAQTGVAMGASAVGTAIADRVANKLEQVAPYTSHPPRTFTGKMFEHLNSRTGRMVGLGLGIGGLMDYGAVKINNAIGNGALQKQAKKNKSGIHIKPQNKGLLHKKLGISQGKHIGNGTLASAKARAKANGNVKLEKEIVFAENAKKWNHK